MKIECLTTSEAEQDALACSPGECSPMDPPNINTISVSENIIRIDNEMPIIE